MAAAPHGMDALAVEDRYAVFGNPIAHSRSPAIHAAFAAQTGQRLRYEKILAPLDGFTVAIDEFINRGGRGANVTLPFKLAACALAGRLTARAQAAGAVNTLSFDGDDIVGDNTDGIGLVTDIVHNAGVALVGRRVLLLGAGGAAQGVVLPLIDAGCAVITVANRSPEKAVMIARRFAPMVEASGIARAGAAGAASGCVLQGCALEALAATDADGAPYDLIINATSASLSDAVPSLPQGVIGAGSFAYDMMYGAAPTAFMRIAAAQGAIVRDGLGMLVEQAAEAFLSWRGVRPDTAPVLAALRAALASPAQAGAHR